MAVFLCLLELAERVMSDCCQRGFCVLSLLELAERVTSGCGHKLTGAGREGYEWLCSYAYWSWQRGL